MFVVGVHNNWLAYHNSRCLSIIKPFSLIFVSCIKIWNHFSAGDCVKTQQTMNDIFFYSPKKLQYLSTRGLSVKFMDRLWFKKKKTACIVAKHTLNSNLHSKISCTIIIQTFNLLCDNRQDCKWDKGRDVISADRRITYREVAKKMWDI